MPKEKKIILYTLDEETIYNYLLKIESDRKVISDLLFDDWAPISTRVRAHLCEYFALLQSIENVLEEVVDDDCRDAPTGSYVTTEKQALTINVFMEGIVHVKELLNDQSVSLYFH